MEEMSGVERRRVHIFGKRIKGPDGVERLGRFLKEYTDEEFQALTIRGLPKGWVAWHVDLPVAEKVRKRILAIPVIETLNPFAGWVPADPEPELREWAQKNA